MIKTSLVNDRSRFKTNITILGLALLLLLLGVNYRQVYSAWVIRSETNRLIQLAESAPEEFQNPQPVEDAFAGRLSSDFWEFALINGAGEVSYDQSWHSAALVFDQSLTLQHFPDPTFHTESPVWHKPAADQYNNIALIGGSGFRPSRSNDVVLKFSAQVSKDFYGTAGVVVQPVDTIREDGFIMKPFDMFGFSIAGEESSIQGISGPLCYLALNWVPAHVQPLPVDSLSLHTYEIRLQWLDQTRWLGIVKVDDRVQCQIEMPPFGPVEVHVWSDNYLVLTPERRLWEFAPTMDLKYQDGGNKRFRLEMIQVFEEAR